MPKTLILMLPELPTQHKASEAKFGVAFRKWWNANPLPGTFELKHTHGKDSLPFSSVEAEQTSFALTTNSKKGCLVRVASGTIGASDYIGLVASPAWVVIKYPREFHIISIHAFIFEQARSKRRSLTLDRARAISTISV